MPRSHNDGLYKRCDCARRKWLKCEHGWHFDFYRGRKFRYSLDVIARARGEQPPRAKGDAEALRDRIRGEIRSSTFKDPNAKPEPVSTDARLTIGDVIDRYINRHVKSLTRRESAQQTRQPPARIGLVTGRCEGSPRARQHQSDQHLSAIDGEVPRAGN